MGNIGPLKYIETIEEPSERRREPEPTFIPVPIEAPAAPVTTPERELVPA